MSKKRKRLELGVLVACLVAALAVGGCGKGQGDVTAQEAPPAEQIIQGVDVTLFSVDHPEQYPIVTATGYDAPSQLTATGVVTPDIARSMPVITLASGRVVDIRARLGDTVQKDQVLLRVRNDDVGMGFDAYRKAISDELLARKQLERTKDLYEHGAMAQQDLEAVIDNEDDAKTTLDTATEHLHLLDNDPDKPNGVVDIVAPISGVITDQEVTNAASVQAYSSPNPFTISDLSTVWIVCDVYESDMATVRMGGRRRHQAERLSGQNPEGQSQQHRSYPRSKHSLRQGSPGSAQPGLDDACGNVCYGYFLQHRQAHLHVRAVLRDSAFARSRLGLHPHARGIPPHASHERCAVAERQQEILTGLQPGQQVVSNAGTIQNAIDNE